MSLEDGEFDYDIGVLSVDEDEGYSRRQQLPQSNHFKVRSNKNSQSK